MAVFVDGRFYYNHMFMGYKYSLQYFGIVKIVEISLSMPDMKKKLVDIFANCSNSLKISDILRKLESWTLKLQ